MRTASWFMQQDDPAMRKAGTEWMRKLRADFNERASAEAQLELGGKNEDVSRKALMRIMDKQVRQKVFSLMPAPRKADVIRKLHALVGDAELVKQHVAWAMIRETEQGGGGLRKVTSAAAAADAIKLLENYIADPVRRDDALLDIQDWAEMLQLQQNDIRQRMELEAAIDPTTVNVNELLERSQ
jgi:hypothetical protein